jgi:hypothetical protein
MQLHELLRETARRFREGEYRWVQDAMAYKLPPGHTEFAYDEVIITAVTDPAATCFCAAGGMLRTLGVEFLTVLEHQYPEANAMLARALEDLRLYEAKEDVDLNYWPIIDFNDSSNTSRDQIVAALERAAQLATPPDPED